MRCESGVLTWQGMTTTPMTMREAEIRPGQPWDYYCCGIGETLPDGDCSVPATFEARPVPGIDLITGLLVGVLLLGALYERARSSRTAGALPRLRFYRQRRSLRDRLREVLWR